MEIESKDKAEEFKTIGNDYFKKKAYAQAIENYTKAIGIIWIYKPDLNEKDPTYYGNRAACYL